MTNSRSKNAILNIVFGYIAQLGILILSFLGRKIFLNFLSVDYLGVNGLYSNILTVLSFAELGLDTAVVYSLYKPVAEDNKPLIYSLIKYFKKIYAILAVAIFVVGIAITPFLKYVINSNLQLNELIIYYVLFLINTVASYFVAHKIALLSASQEQRVQKIVSLLTNLLLQIIYIIVLVIWHNYYIYVAATVITTIINSIILDRICSRLHRDIFSNKLVVEFDKKPIKQRVFSTFLYKIGSVLINNTDNILISIIVSTAAVGLYSNYYTVISAITGFIAIITMSLISGIGNLGANGNKQRLHEIFDVLLLFYHCVAALGGIGFALLFNNLISVWLGKQYLFDQSIVFIIAFNFYVTNAFNPVWMYREANGLFKPVRFLMLIRAAINIILSITFGILWGTFGILLATAVSLVLTSFWYEPKILFKHLFQSSSKEYWLKQFKYGLVTIVVAVLSYFATHYLSDSIVMLIVKIIIIVFIVVAGFILISLKSKEMKVIKSLLKRGKNK